MKFSCLQENLSRGLATVGRAVATRSTLPITQNVLLSSDQGMLRLSATNLEIAITTRIGAMIEQEGAITVPHRLLTDLVNALPNDRVDIDLITPDDNEVEMGAAAAGTSLHIACGRSVTNIHTAPARDFPPIPQIEEGIAARIEPGTLRAAIGMVAFCAGTDESRPVLTGVEVKMHDDKLVMAAADGFRLSVYTKQLPSAVDEEITVIVPARTLQEVQRMASEQTSPVRITLAPEKGQALFKTENVDLVSQLLQGNFPNYEQLIPDRYDTRAVLDPADFKRASDTATVLARDGSNIIRMEITPQEEGEGGQLKISARSEDIGQNENEMDIEALDGEANRIALNSRYLRDIVNVLGKDKIAMEVTNPSAPAVFRAAEDSEGYVHVVMPMYVQW